MDRQIVISVDDKTHVAGIQLHGKFADWELQGLADLLKTMSEIKTHQAMQQEVKQNGSQ